MVRARRQLERQVHCRIGDTVECGPAHERPGPAARFLDGGAVPVARPTSDERALWDETRRFCGFDCEPHDAMPGNWIAQRYQHFASSFSIHASARALPESLLFGGIWRRSETCECSFCIRVGYHSKVRSSRTSQRVWI